MCQITLKTRTKEDQFIPEADFNFIRRVRITKLQNQGYAYVKPLNRPWRHTAMLIRNLSALLLGCLWMTQAVLAEPSAVHAVPLTRCGLYKDCAGVS